VHFFRRARGLLRSVPLPRLGVDRNSRSREYMRRDTYVAPSPVGDAFTAREGEGVFDEFVFESSIWTAATSIERSEVAVDCGHAV